MRTTASSALRWALVPVAAVVGFLASFILAVPLNRFIHWLVWSAGHPMPGKLFLLYVLPYDGALAASLFILLGAWAAPRHRFMIALLLFFIGGRVAWSWVGEFYSPLRPPNGEIIRVWWPIIGTCTGGLLACILALILFRPKQVA